MPHQPPASDQPAATGRADFPKANRLLRKRDFDRVFGRKCSTGSGALVVYAETNDLGRPRLGLVVSRKHGPAVVRNRWKRRLREAFRLEKQNLPQDVDLVVLPRRGEVADVSELRRQLVTAVRRLRRRLPDRRNE